MPKVILIQATQYSSDGRTLCKQKRIYLPGLALPLLAAFTPSFWDIKIVIEVIEDIDFDEDCDLVGIGAMGHAVFRAIDIADEFRKRGKIVFFGGYMASIFPEIVRNHCDSIVTGDAEISYPQLLNDYTATGKIKSFYNNQLSSLDGMPLPRYDLLLQKKIGFMLPVQAGRGCSHTCLYCSIACVYKGRYLVRPIDEVIRDIIHIRKLGFKYFYLIDDNIVSNPEFLIELASRVKSLRMIWASQSTILIAKNDRLLKAVSDSGCRILSMGLESLSQQGLDTLNKSWVKVSQMDALLKKIRNAGILLATEMMVGTDGDTPASIKKTISFIVNSRIPIPKFYVLTPIPGTGLFKQFQKEGRLLHNDYTRYTGTQCVFLPRSFTPEELNSMYWDLYSQTYSFMNILKRTLFNPGIIKTPILYLFAFYSNLVYRRYIKAGNAPNIL